jgi:predicted ATPase/class 3 adenylate cyclase
MATEIQSGSQMHVAPSGTVTFLFTDIEGSTQRWERYRERMASAVGRHDALMRAAIAAHDGDVFKTVGDAFCSAFATASDAAATAIDAQRALLAEDFSAIDGLLVRMALHTGTANERDGDYFGQAVNRVARLLAIGHGGQVLVSATTADLLQGEMPTGSSLRDLGARALKDLARPERVYQVVAPDLRTTFPELRSLDALPNNLPLQLTSFVGRERDVAEIEKLLQANRLVTLVGSGGAGKTRAAIEAGARVVDAIADGVWLVELAPISDPSLVTATIARVLDIRESTSSSPLETLVAHLKERHLLLILDNCEHVIDAVRSVAGAILRNCPEVRILATSRASLNIAGEHVSRLPSLAVPPAGKDTTAKAALPYGAVELFTDRAVAADARFALTDANARFVSEICQRLDGIPLAIELAAARVSVLSPRQLAQRLDERFRVLTGGDRSALPRHQTMRALIDWSYDLLGERERSLFRKLSIFASGFTLEGAGIVGGDETRDEIEALDLVSSLVDKSLVQAEPGEDSRYRMLESTRQYARERLSEHGEFDISANRHLAYVSELVKRAGEEYESSMSGVAVTRLVVELEDVRGALDWAVRQRDAAAAADLFLASRLWIHLGLHREAIERAKRLLTLVGDDDAPRLARLWERIALCDAGIGNVASATDASERCRNPGRLPAAIRGRHRARSMFRQSSGCARRSRCAGSAFLAPQGAIFACARTPRIHSRRSGNCRTLFWAASRPVCVIGQRRRDRVCRPQLGRGQSRAGCDPRGHRGRDR